MTNTFNEPAVSIPGPTTSLGDDSNQGPYEIVCSLQTDVGCHREVNEDRGLLKQPGDPELKLSKGLLMLVCDGMGGHSAGEVASELAVDVISHAYFDDPAEPQTALTNAIHEANRRVYQKSQATASLSGMGTTCSALVIWGDSAMAAHIGDSRVYLIRNGQIYLMTEDHSAVMEMVRQGVLSREDARHHPDKNVILRALGSQPEVEVTTWEHPLRVRAGDAFLVCSDGLYDLVEDQEMLEIVKSREPLSACETLIARAKERGGHDNITVGILSLKPLRAEERRIRDTREVEVVK
jgi:protein phosphatase